MNRPVPQQGIALAMLLWMLAALSLLVAGVVHQSRTDVQLTRLHLDSARARAVGTGAAHLLLAERSVADNDEDNPGGGIFTRSFTLDGLSIEARAIPLSGLISLNQADKELLKDLFRYTGAVKGSKAEELATAVIRWRNPPSRIPDTDAENEDESHGKFRVIEDLLRVPGMTRNVYDRVRAAVHVQPGGETAIDPRAAPPAVLLTLAQGNQALVNRVRRTRQDPASNGNLSGQFDKGYVIEGSATASAFCVVVDISLGERILRQRIWVQSGNGSAVPWRFTRVEPLIAKPGTIEEDRDAS